MDSTNEKDTQFGVTEEIHIDPAAEKRLIRKLDLMLSPMMVLIFLVAYLDRSNIGESIDQCYYFVLTFLQAMQLLQA